MADNKIPETFGSGDNMPKNQGKSDNKFVAEKPKTEKDVIRYLEAKQTNFVFLFGASGVGKSAIVASMLHYLSTDTKYSVEVLRNAENSEGTSYLLQFRDDIRNQRFPGRTDQKRPPFNLDMLFYHKNEKGDKLAGIPLTFLEMSGEDLKEVEVFKPGMSKDVQENAKGKLPDPIDVYFKADNLSMLFLMVTTPERASIDDILMTEFIDYISSKDRKYSDAYLSLIIAQYDRFSEFTSGLNIQDFVKKSMPNSYAKFHSNKNRYCYYSVGDVIMVKEEKGGKTEDVPHIKRLDSKSPHQLFSWIYETITKKKLNPLSFWERIEKLLKF